MEALLAALENTAVAEALRLSRWGYAGVSAAHVFGIALLVGAILPLNLRLLGAWPDIPRRALAKVLVPFAASGLALAVVAGALLFSVRASEYAGVGFFQVKLALIALGTASAALAHLFHGPQLECGGETRLKLHALLSTTCWLGGLLCGRLIAFADI